MLTPLVEWRQGRVIAGARSGSATARAQVATLTSAERDVDWVSGACLLVRRDAALAAGLLDERYFMYEEDVDFCAALRARGGHILFTPAAQITHLRGRSISAAAPRSPSYYDESHVRFYQKHAPHWVPLLRLWQRLKRR
jgi:GT2 family glycosyltransferase